MYEIFPELYAEVVMSGTKVLLFHAYFIYLVGGGAVGGHAAQLMGS